MNTNTNAAKSANTTTSSITTIPTTTPSISAKPTQPKPVKGIIPIAAATFTPEGRFDEDSFQQMIRHLLGTGVNGITIFGLATEFYKLTQLEMNRMMELFLAETSKATDVAGMVSITDHTLETAVIRAQQAEAAGADCLMLLPPFFLQPSAPAIIAHIKAVAASVSIPIVVQYAPAQTGVRMTPELFIQLREEHENLQYVKVETQPPGRYVTDLIEGSQGRLGALVGYAGVQMPDVLQRGAAGIQPGCSFSEIYVELYRLYTNNDQEGFLQLFRELLPYISYWMQGVELIIKAEKVILHKRGIIASDYCRGPAYTLDERELLMIEGFLAHFAGYWGRRV